MANRSLSRSSLLCRGLTNHHLNQEKEQSRARLAPGSVGLADDSRKAGAEACSQTGHNAPWNLDPSSARRRIEQGWSTAGEGDRFHANRTTINCPYPAELRNELIFSARFLHDPLRHVWPWTPLIKEIDLYETPTLFAAMLGLSLIGMRNVGPDQGSAAAPGRSGPRHHPAVVHRGRREGAGPDQ